MIVDSSALPEQVVADVLASAFDSAGQRCSALRVLCVQEEVAGRVIEMLKGAMAELSVGNPDRLSTDVGPVISAGARDAILAHVAAMRARGHAAHALPLPIVCAHGTFVPPTLIEITRMGELQAEVFGPVLHLLRFRRDELRDLVRDIAATGYGLTFGIHSRVGETIARITGHAPAGNLYVNRNMIGAVVGVQPFGGHGLSGTGPKAGGPLALRRLSSACPADPPLPATPRTAEVQAFLDWLTARHPDLMATVLQQADAGRIGLDIALTGPVGEENRYALHPRGTVLCQAGTRAALLVQIVACLATGNRARIAAPSPVLAALDGLPLALAARIVPAEADDPDTCDAILFDGEEEALRALLRRVAASEGAIRPVLALPRGQVVHRPDMLFAERSTSTNTAAAGGNAALMSL